MTQNNINRMRSPISHLVLRMLISLMVSSAGIMLLDLVLRSIIPEDWGLNCLLILSPFITIVVCCILYSDAWRTAERDQNLVKYGHIVYRKYKGLIAGMIASLPGLLLALGSILMVGSDNVRTDALGALCRIFYEMMFTAFYWLHYILDYSAVALLLPICVLPAAAVLGYYMGYRGIYIRSYVMYNKKELEKKQSKR